MVLVAIRLVKIFFSKCSRQSTRLSEALALQERPLVVAFVAMRLYSVGLHGVMVAPWTLNPIIRVRVSVKPYFLSSFFASIFPPFASAPRVIVLSNCQRLNNIIHSCPTAIVSVEMIVMLAHLHDISIVLDMSSSVSGSFTLVTSSRDHIRLFVSRELERRKEMAALQSAYPQKPPNE